MLEGLDGQTVDLAEWLGLECDDEHCAKSGWRPVDNTTLGGDREGCTVDLVQFNILLMICMMGQSLLSANLPMAYMWLMGQRGMLAIQHKLNRLKKRGNFSARKSVKSSTWWWTITSMCWWTAAWDDFMTWASDTHWWQRGTSILVFSEFCQQVEGDAILFCSALLMPPLKYCVSSGLLNTRETWIYGSEFSERSQRR